MPEPGASGILPTDAVTAWDIETDVLVVGGGACGLTAALLAGRAGKEVLLVDRDHRPVSNTARSSGMIPAAGTSLQHAAGVTETADDLVADIQRKNGHQADVGQVEHLAATIRGLVDWFVAEQVVDLRLVDDFLYPGHATWRMHAPPERTGARILEDLLAAVRRLPNVTIVQDATCDGLIGNSAGVAGALVRTDSDERVAAAAVILATNGFAGNPAMIAEWCPEIAGALYFGSPWSTGDGIRWGVALGGAVAFMDAYQGMGSIALPSETYLSYSVIMNGGFQVDRHGHRFSDETRGYSEQATTVLQQDGGVAFAIWDEERHRVGLTFGEYRASLDLGAVRIAGSLDELAGLLGVDSAGLDATMAEYDAAARTGRDRFGRTTFAELRPPLYGARITGALFHTQGGLQVDRDARVVRADGSPVAGLYAGGGAAAGISGHGAAGYLSGNGLLTALAYGALAGQHAGSLAL